MISRANIILNIQQPARSFFLPFIGVADIYICNTQIIRHTHSGSTSTSLARTISPPVDTASYLNIYLLDLPGFTSTYSSNIVYLDFIVGSNIWVHEIGHWCGLNHPWGTMSTAGSCGVDDGIADTPPTYRPNYTCTPRSDCGQLEMYENLMDFSSCGSVFTQGQVDSMHSFLSLWRPQVDEGNLVNTGCLSILSITDTFSCDNLEGSQFWDGIMWIDWIGQEAEYYRKDKQVIRCVRSSGKEVKIYTPEMHMELRGWWWLR
jgi:hypothetical protein